MRQADRPQPGDYPKFASALEKYQPSDRWGEKAMNIGMDIEQGDYKHRMQMKGLAERENHQLMLANEMHNTVLLKGVLHKGYWKYKPKHYAEQQSTNDSPGKSHVQQSPIKAFDADVTECIQFAKKGTAIEKKYAGTDRFNFDVSDLAKYDKL